MAPLRIDGRVVDADERPVPGVRVMLRAGRPDVFLPDVALLTGDDGGFALEVPTPGEYVVAAHGDTASAEVLVQVPTRGTVVVRLDDRVPVPWE